MEKYPDFEALALFTKVVELGSFARVCQQLKIPKATLSRKIAQLESDLSAQLLVRNTRKIQLTEVGREVLTRAHSLLGILEDSHELIARTKTEPQGLLRISAGVEYGLSIVSPIVDAYCKKFPKVRVELDLSGRRIDLIYEGFDLGIRIGPLEDSTLSMRKIGTFRYGLYASPEFLKKHKGVKSPTQLASLPTLGFSRVNANKWTLVRELEELTLDVSPRVISNNYWVLVDAAVAGLGVVFMPKFLAEKKVEAGLLSPLLSEWSSVEIPIHFIYPAQRFLSPKVRSFIEEFKRSL